MKRFVQVNVRVWDYIDSSEVKSFEDRCSCAIACGYVPCGSMLQSTLESGQGNFDRDHQLTVEAKSNIYLVQNFYDPDGKATPICMHCTKCESCDEIEQSEIYCSKFEDTCYADDSSEEEEEDK